VKALLSSRDLSWTSRLNQGIVGPVLLSSVSSCVTYPKMVNVFAVPVFFIVLRETTETSIIVSVLLAFLKQQIGPHHDKALYRKLQKQVSSSYPSSYRLSNSP
jgi:Iron permease FTR1 family